MSNSQAHEFFLQGWALHQQGKPAEARARYALALESEPQHFDALHLSGIAAGQLGDLAGMAELIGKAAAVQPENPLAHFNHGAALEKLGRADDALASFDRAIALKPDYAEAYHGQANILASQDRLVLAVAGFAKAVALRPGDAGLRYQYGCALRRTGDMQAALTQFETACGLNPGAAEIHLERGIALWTMARADEALQAYDRALTLNPALTEAHINRGVVLRALRRLPEALAALDKAIALKPDHAGAHNNRGAVLMDMGDHAAAVAGFDRAIALQPTNADAFNNRAVALDTLGRYDAALASADEAIRLKANYAGAHNSRGVVLMDMGDHSAAIASFDRAVELHPGHADAFNNRAVALKALGRHDAALASVNEALRLDVGHAKAHYNRGNVLVDLNRLEEAASSFARALEINPDSAFLRGTLLHLRMQLCDWSNFEAGVSAINAGVTRGEKVTPPFQILALTPSLSLHKRAAEIWAADQAIAQPLHRRSPCRSNGKIRIGYFSSDFHVHPVAAQAVEMFERHDRSTFETFAFSFGQESRDAMRARLKSAFYEFIDVRERGDREIAALAQERDLDVAIDLTGYTSKARTGIFAQRVAPVQIGYLGYPGTMGVDYIDYIIGDDVVIPAGSEAYYSEKIMRLPCFMPSDTRRPIGTSPTRADMGLPEGAFVFCAFNNGYKITPGCFARWMKILRCVDGSVLWLSANNDVAKRNLRAEAARAGIDPERLVFANRVPGIDAHLARHQLADLFLDTAPYNAHSTACDALYAGLPVLTLAQESYAGRVAASLLTAAGLTELMMQSEEAYEALAVELAADPGRLAALKEKLARRGGTLFDVTSLTRHLENAYTQAVERARAGLPPAHIRAKLG